MLAALICLQTTLQYRWIYGSFNMLVDASVPVVQDLLKRGKAAGYNGFVLADYKLQILDLLGDNTPRYRKNIAAIKQTADELGMELVPGLSGPGYADGILAHDVNLVEGPPVKDQPFTAHNGKAVLDADSSSALVNADFEQVQGDRFAGWDFQDGIGKSTFADSAVVHGGKLSLRMEHIDRIEPETGNCRISQLRTVKPWRLYHISVWIKSQDFANPGDIRVAVLTPEGKSLAFQDSQVQPTQDWKKVDVVFNSLQNTQARVYYGVWGGKSGKLWWDDGQMSEIGLVNVIRRSSCPLKVTGEDGQTTYTEGKDFEQVQDPRLGVIPWPGSYETFHEEPQITLTKSSRIREGEHLRVSYYAALMAGAPGQAGCSLADPRFFEIMSNEFKTVKELLQPKSYFLGHDEIRCVGWDAYESKAALGETLAGNIRRLQADIKQVSPGARTLVWSDMFDPSHNAHGDYYLANGDFTGSWKGLDPSTIIVNWNSFAVEKSMDHFGKLGNPQILAGYYDSDPDAIKTWLAKTKGRAKVIGVMYTTWQGNYKDLEAFAKAAWGGYSLPDLGVRRRSARPKC